MKIFYFLCFAIILIVTSVGCASHRSSRLAWTTGAFTAGLAIGSASAPKEERKELHALYWAGLLGLGAAIASEFYYSDQEALHKLSLENDKLKAEMELINNAGKVLLQEGTGKFKNSPALGQKSKWKVFEVNRWEKAGPDRLHHIDKVIEILPEEKK